MESWQETAVLWDEDALYNFFDKVKEKVYKLWEEKKQIDIEVKLDFVDDLED